MLQRHLLAPKFAALEVSKKRRGFRVPDSGPLEGKSLLFLAHTELCHGDRPDTGRNLRKLLRSPFADSMIMKSVSKLTMQLPRQRKQSKECILGAGFPIGTKKFRSCLSDTKHLSHPYRV